MSKKAYYEYHEQRYLTGIINFGEFERLVNTLNDAKLAQRLEEHRKNSR